MGGLTEARLRHVIEAMRALMTTGNDWGLISTALAMIGALGVVLQSITLWAFARLAR